MVADEWGGLVSGRRAMGPHVREKEGSLALSWVLSLTARLALPKLALKGEGEGVGFHRAGPVRG